MKYHPRAAVVNLGCGLDDTTNGKFMSPFEAAWMGLSGSKLLVGRK